LWATPSQDQSKKYLFTEKYIKKFLGLENIKVLESCKSYFQVSMNQNNSQFCRLQFPAGHNFYITSLYNIVDMNGD